MIALAIGGGILIALALIIREWQNHVGTVQAQNRHTDLQEELRTTQEEARCTLEDLFVLRTVLAEHGIVDEIELAQGRQRLLDLSRREVHHGDELDLLLHDLCDNEHDYRITAESNNKIH